MAVGKGRRTGGLAGIALVVLIGITLSFFGFRALLDTVKAERRANLERELSQAQHEIEERIGEHGLLLKALRAQLAGRFPPERAEFRRVVGRFQPLFSDLLAVTWAIRDPSAPEPGASDIMVVVPEKLTAPPAAVADAVRPVPPGAQPPTPGDVVGPDPALGLSRQNPLVEACANGMGAVEPVFAHAGHRLEGGSAPASALVLHVPVFADDDSGRRENDDRCASTVGFLGVVFATDHLLSNDQPDTIARFADLYLVTEVPSGRRIVASLPSADDGHATRPLTTPEAVADRAALARGMNLGGGRWVLYAVDPMAGSLEPLAGGPLAVLAVGLLLTLLLALHLYREGVAKKKLQIEACARRSISRRLRESEERFRLALKHSRVALFSLDQDLRIQWAYNPGIVFSTDSVVRKTHADINTPEDASLFERIERRVMETGRSSRHEIRVTVGRYSLVFQLHVEPMYDEDDALCGVICAAIDVTQSWQIKSALAAAHLKAERASREKSRFLAGASHDLRQPFQAMGLFRHLLETRLTDPEALELTRKLGGAINAGEALLSALLDTSALESGKVQPKIQDISLRPLAERLGHEIAPQAAAKGLEFRLRVPEAVVRSDPVLLERMLRNLLVNALRYTQEGGILLGARRRGDRVSVEVWDTGCGIAKDQLDLIFEDFYRCGTDERNSGQGLGLGLSTVRRMSQILDLPVKVESRLGRGTMFSISVPLAGQGEKEEEPPRAAAVG